MGNNYNEEVEWRTRQAQYRWHPLYKYINDVLVIFGLANYRTYKDKSNNIPDDEYQVRFNNLDFNICLEFLKEVYEGKYSSIYNHQDSLKELIDVFAPLTINSYGPYTLFKYSNFITLSDLGENSKDFWSKYDGLYRECRSVVFNLVTMDIVLAPQQKFFNINELSETEEAVVKNRINKASTIEFSDKLDGSNQNYRWYNGQVIGSGSSALDPNISWRLTNGYSLIDENYTKMLKAYPDYTFMFEYISPDNQVVVQYSHEQEGLYLFGMRNVFTGEEFDYSKVLAIGKEYGVKTTELFDTSFDTLLNSLDNYSCNEKEGWVIRIIDDEGMHKYKLKVNDYVLMHHALSKIVSPNSVIQAIGEGKWDDFYSKVPSAYKENVVATKDIVINYINHMQETAKRYIETAKIELGDKYTSVKDFAVWNKKHTPKKYQGYLFALYKGYEVNFIKNGGGGYHKINEMKM